MKMGMKLEAIREDRTRGGRSTYQCSYTIPAGLEPRPGPAPAVPALLQVRKHNTFKIFILSLSTRETRAFVHQTK